MTDIRPQLVDGELMCNAAECPLWPTGPDSDIRTCKWNNCGRCVAGIIQQRDEARAKLEEARERNDKLRKLADESAHESGVYARRMGEAQIEREKLQAEVEQLTARLDE